MAQKADLSRDEPSDNQPYCSQCDSDNHILQVTGTSVEKLNISNQETVVYKCQQCGATGKVCSDYSRGLEQYKGELFAHNRGDGR